MSLKLAFGVAALVLVSGSMGANIYNWLADEQPSQPVASQVIIPSVQEEEVVPSLTASSSRVVSRLNLESSQTVLLLGQIDEGAKAVVSELKRKAKAGKDLYLLIDSPGGSVFDGSLILSAIESSPVKINTVCIGMCASMAFIILQYGNERLGLDRSILMSHLASGGARGSVEQMNSLISFVTRYLKKTDGYIAKRAGLSLAQYKQLIVTDYWIDAEDATQKKLLDGVVDINVDRGSLTDLFTQLKQELKTNKIKAFNFPTEWKTIPKPDITLEWKGTCPLNR